MLRTALVLLACALISSPVRSQEALSDYRPIELPICGDSVVTNPAGSFVIDIATPSPDPNCQPPFPVRPVGHLYLLGPAGEPNRNLTLSQSGAWALSNLDTSPNNDFCVPEHLRDRPIAMGCGQRLAGRSRRNGFSQHQLLSLHGEEETEFASLKARINGNPAVPVVVEASFGIRDYVPSLGPTYHEFIRRHFVLRISRKSNSSTEAIEQDFGLDSEAGKENRLVAKFYATEDETVVARFVFRPIKRHTITGTAFQTFSSDDIRLRIWLQALRITRGSYDTIEKAIRNDDTEAAHHFIEAGANLSTPTSNGLTPLALAMWLGREKIASELAAANAADNRGEFLTAKTSRLLDLLGSNLRPDRIVADIMRNNLILTKAPATGAGAGENPSLPFMTFSGSSRQSVEGCDDVTREINSSAKQFVSDKVDTVNCVYENTTAGLYSMLGERATLSSVGVLQLSTREPSDPAAFGMTSYIAHIASAAYGGISYEGQWPLGFDKDRSAGIAYDLTGVVTLPACTNAGNCQVFRRLWYSEKHTGSGMQSSVKVDQNAASQLLTPGNPIDLDMSRGPATITLTMSRAFTHTGGNCCFTAEDSHFVSIQLADVFQIAPTDYILAATHTPDTGTEDPALTASRVDNILQRLNSIVQSATPETARVDILALAQTGDARSHPFEARFADLYLRLALIDHLLRDAEFPLNPDNRHALELVHRALSEAARTLYLPEATSRFGSCKSDAIRLHLREANELAELIGRPAGSPGLSDSERNTLINFVTILKLDRTEAARRFLATATMTADRSTVADALLAYISWSREELGRVKARCEQYALEIAQFEATGATIDARQVLEELTDMAMN